MDQDGCGIVSVIRLDHEVSLEHAGLRLRPTLRTSLNLVECLNN
jgi:hypothetical protein